MNINNINAMQVYTQDFRWGTDYWVLGLDSGLKLQQRYVRKRSDGKGDGVGVGWVGESDGWGRVMREECRKYNRHFSI